MFEFNRPNWRLQSDYMMLKKASFGLLAWEFLRRNKDYHQDWIAYCQRLLQGAEGKPQLLKYVEYLISANPSEKMALKLEIADSRDRLHAELFNTVLWVADPEDDECRRYMNLGAIMGRRWGIQSLANPNNAPPLGVPMFLEKGATFSIILDQSGVQNLRPRKDDSAKDLKYLTIKVDLTLPLEVIEAAFMAAIRNERDYRTQTGKITPMKEWAQSHEKYIEYIRLIDACSEEVSVRDIGDVLSPTEKNDPPDWTRDKRLRAAIKKAEKLVAEEYVVLPKFDKWPKSKKK